MNVLQMRAIVYETQYDSGLYRSAEGLRQALRDWKRVMGILHPQSAAQADTHRYMQRVEAKLRAHITADIAAMSVSAAAPAAAGHGGRGGRGGRGRGGGASE